ncbi:sensor domain-containing diguanylate cyclase [Comamonas testosteroni]|uniref:sensor domain-containing diguanylate cyclase n=1 Tax=Comamonas testosteroni TaxID=285 RepID=UPI0026EFD5A2|nr:sensor domain-containing diguanylate cyclase [Comamonas testosteroni]
MSTESAFFAQVLTVAIFTQQKNENTIETRNSIVFIAQIAGKSVKFNISKIFCRIDLRRLILFLTVASACTSLINTFYAAYTVQRQQLIDENLNVNFVYANKLAKSTDDFLKAAQQQLAASSAYLSNHFNNIDALSAESERLKNQTESFNSILIVDARSSVLASSPAKLKLTGRTLSTSGVIESIETKKPLISDSYISTVGNLLIFISHPIHDSSGNYLGMVAGTIYLNQQSILNDLLGTHYYNDGSYLYVVDKNKKLIYHPDQNRIGTLVNGNEVIGRIQNGESGSRIVQNTRGIEMVSGYAIIPTTRWGVVSQRPMSATLAPLDSLMKQVVLKTLPVAIVSVLLICWCAHRIAKPLRLLSEDAKDISNPEIANKIQNIKSWYVEAHDLKKAMLIGLSLLNENIEKLQDDVKTDPLTKLGNRRSLEAALQNLEASSQFFSVVSIDIDHFKKVNDTFGHDVGDIVLRDLAKQMRLVSRADDLPCRIGGEEFLIVLPRASENTAAQVAERLRKQVEETVFEGVGHITISLGVASWPNSSSDIPTVIKYADEMLYKAKREGRNRVAVYRQSETEEMQPA